MVHTLTVRKLNLEEAAVFSNEIRSVPGIVGYLPSELVALPSMVVLEVGRAAAGVLAYTDAPDFVELKLLLVRSQFRGHGYSRLLFDDFSRRFAGSTKLMYAVTKNPIVKHLACAEGYEQSSFWALPTSCKLHQVAFMVSWYRFREYLRKRFRFPDGGAFQYWVKRPNT